MGGGGWESSVASELGDCLLNGARGMEDVRETERDETLRIVSYNVGLRGLRKLALQPDVALHAGTASDAGERGRGDAHGVVRRAGYGGLENFLTVLCPVQVSRSIVCVQEVKVAQSKLSADMALARDYDSFFCLGASAYAGVGVFVSKSVRVASCVRGAVGLMRMAEVDEVTDAVTETLRKVGQDHGIDRDGSDRLDAERVLATLRELDGEGRCIAVDIGDAVVVNVYAPAAGESGDRGFHKALYLSSILDSCSRVQVQRNVPVVLVGDLNVAYAARDVPSDELPTSMTREDPSNSWASRCPARMALLQHLLRKGAVDCFRRLHPDSMDAYSCWNVAAGMQISNYGSRIDHVILFGGESVASIEDCNYLRHINGSDHAPMYCEFRQLRQGQRACDSLPMRGEHTVASSRSIFERGQTKLKAFLKMRIPGAEHEEEHRQDREPSASPSAAAARKRTRREPEPELRSIKQFFLPAAQEARKEIRRMGTDVAGRRGGPIEATCDVTDASNVLAFEGSSDPRPEPEIEQDSIHSRAVRQEVLDAEKEHVEAAKEAWRQVQLKMAHSIPLCNKHRYESTRTFFCFPAYVCAHPRVEADHSKE